MSYVSSILLIERNPLDARTIGFALVRHSVEGLFVHTKDCDEACLYLRNFAHERPSLILLDLESSEPGTHGFIRLIKSDERLWHVPMVVITRTPEQHPIDTYLNMGVDDHLCKPEDYSELSDQVGSLARYWTDPQRRLKIVAA